MSGDTIENEYKEGIAAVKYYTTRLNKIKGSKEYYSWFDKRLSSINEVLPEYSVFIDEFNQLNQNINEIPDQFAQSFINLAIYFSRFYHVKSIYDSCETGKINPYFVDNLQFNVMVRFFNFINTDPTKLLIPPPYDLQFMERSRGVYNEDAEYSSTILQITNESLANPMYQMIFLSIKIIYYNRDTHQNILFFNKNTMEIYLIEPSLEMNLQPGKSQGTHIDSFIPAITQYINLYFGNYTFKGFFRTAQCSLPYHGGLCAPLSFVLVLRPDITDYNSLARLIKIFVDNVIQEISEFHRLLQYGMQNPTANATRDAPSTFTEDFSAYDRSGDSDYESESSNFGKIKSEIDYLKKLCR